MAVAAMFDTSGVCCRSGQLYWPSAHIPIELMEKGPFSQPWVTLDVPHTKVVASCGADDGVAIVPEDCRPGVSLGYSMSCSMNDPVNDSKSGSLSSTNGDRAGLSACWAGVEWQSMVTVQV